RLPESPAAFDSPPVTEHQCEARARFGVRFHIDPQQLLLVNSAAPQVTAECTQGHPGLPAVLDLRETARSVLFQHLLNFACATSSCHAASIDRLVQPFKRASSDAYCLAIQRHDSEAHPNVAATALKASQRNFR